MFSSAFASSGIIEGMHQCSRLLLFLFFFFVHHRLAFGANHLFIRPQVLAIRSTLTASNIIDGITSIRAIFPIYSRIRHGRAKPPKLSSRKQDVSDGFSSLFVDVYSAVWDAECLKSCVENANEIYSSQSEETGVTRAEGRDKRMRACTKC